MASMVRMQVLSGFEIEWGFRWLIWIGPRLVIALVVRKVEVSVLSLMACKLGR